MATWSLKRICIVDGYRSFPNIITFNPRYSQGSFDFDNQSGKTACSLQYLVIYNLEENDNENQNSKKCSNGVVSHISARLCFQRKSNIARYDETIDLLFE